MSMGKNSDPSTGDAKTHLLDLLTRSGDSVTEFSQINFNLDYLDKMNGSFVPSAITLLETGSLEERKMANDVLRTWVADGNQVPAARHSANAANKGLGTQHDESSYILEQVIREKSHERIFPSFPNYFTDLKISKCYAGDKLILRNRADLRPNIFEAGDNEIDHYYHPLIVTAAIFDPSNDEERFFREAPSFFEWVAASENMNDMLSGALQTKSINPDTILAIMGMRVETSVPLYDGLI
jgi:hypothetical protein